MVTSIPMNRIGAHFDAPPKPLPELPKSARERGFLWNDAVLQAVLALQNQLNNSNAAVVAAAANSILQLEQTRIRHGRNVSGSESVSTAQLEYEEQEREAKEHEERHRAQRRAAQAAQPKATDAPKNESRTDEQALAEHIREVTEYTVAKGQPLPGGPANFVPWQLKQWGISANAIPKGGFLDYLREHDDDES